jgi:hypothetical protein
LNDEQSPAIQQLVRQVRSMFYLVDEPATMLTIQVDGQAIIARATDPVALNLRTLPRGAMICATLNDEQLLAFKVLPL